MIVETEETVDIVDDEKQKTLKLLNIYKPKAPGEASAILNAKVDLKTSRGHWRKYSLSSLASWQIEYINDNPDEPYGSDPAFRFAGWHDKLLGQAAAWAEYLEGRARLGSGGGLFQSRPDVVHYRLSPERSPVRQNALVSGFENLPGYVSLDSTPPHNAPIGYVAETEDKEELVLYQKYQFESPIRHVTRNLYAYGKDVKSPGTLFDIDTGLTPTKPTKKLPPFVHGMKRAESQAIDDKLLKTWSGVRSGFRPDQNTAMGGVSAKEAAIAAKVANAETTDWQWLHLIAFTLGGDSGNTANPNVPENLVAGTAAANGKHLVLENFVKKLIMTGQAEVVNVSAVAFMKKPKWHLAERIRYTVAFKKNKTDALLSTKTINYEFSALDPNQSAGGDLAVLWTMATSGQWFI